MQELGSVNLLTDPFFFIFEERGDAPISEIAMTIGDRKYSANYDDNSPGAPKTFFLDLREEDGLTGFLNIQTNVSNSVSFIEQSIVVKSHYQELNDMRIVPLDVTTCILRPESPAAEVSSSCWLSVGSSSDIKNWTDFQITWFENNDPNNVIDGSFENKAPYRPKVKFLKTKKGKG